MEEWGERAKICGAVIQGPGGERGEFAMECGWGRRIRSGKRVEGVLSE